MTTVFAKLTGPRGSMGNHTVVAKSFFVACGDKWQWQAFDHDGSVITVCEMGWSDPCAYMPQSADGALWTLREIAAAYFHNVRAHRE